MNTKGIKRAKDWPFEMPQFLSSAIDDLVDAMSRNDSMIDCYMDEVEGCSRGVCKEYDHQLFDYYLRGGYHADIID